MRFWMKRRDHNGGRGDTGEETCFASILSTKRTDSCKATAIRSPWERIGRPGGKFPSIEARRPGLGEGKLEVSLFFVSREKFGTWKGVARVSG